MEKGNHYRKLFYMDLFAQHWYCKHARLNQLRREKREAKRLVRRTWNVELHKMGPNSEKEIENP